MTIFPYLYPDLEDQDFEDLAPVVVEFFMSILILSMTISTTFVAFKMYKNKRKQPVFEANSEVRNQGQINEDLRQQWIEGVNDSSSEFESSYYSQSDLNSSEVQSQQQFDDSKVISSAEVNLMNTGFSTGMSKLREAKIQQYRANEKQLN